VSVRRNIAMAWLVFVCGGLVSLILVLLVALGGWLPVLALVGFMALVITVGWALLVMVEGE
jgi:hypothetical protein